MWINTKTLKTFSLLSDIRIDCASISLPETLTNELLANLDYEPITPTVAVFDHITKNAVEATPIKIDGVWIQQWQIVDLGPDAVRENRRLASLSNSYAPLVLTTPPAFNPANQKLTNPTPVLDDDFHWVQQWAVVNLTAPEIAAALAATKATLSAAIEAAVVSVYSRPVTLAREYELREADAMAFVAANYVGTPGRVLAGFATSSGMTPTAAANLVIAQSNAFRGAELALADLRMRKYEVNRATTAAQANTIHSETIAAIAVIAAQIA